MKTMPVKTRLAAPFRAVLLGLALLGAGPSVSPASDRVIVECPFESCIIDCCSPWHCRFPPF